MLIAEEKVAFAQGTISRLEKQWEDNIQSNKDLMASTQQVEEINSFGLFSQ